MHEFDTYINSIIGDLRVSKKKKYEMADEYRDHLEMLRSEYIKNGLEEHKAVEEAIKNFGDSRKLKLRLSQNVHRFRNIQNVLCGIVFTILLVQVGNRVPVPGIIITESIEHYPKYLYLLFMVMSIFMFIPIGYFLPIIFKGAEKIKNISIVAFLLSIGLCAFLSNQFEIVQTECILSCIFGGMLGSMFGYSVLRLVSKVGLAFSR